MPSKTFKKGMDKKEKQEVIENNIKEELKKNPKMKPAQATAIAYAKANEKKKK